MTAPRKRILSAYVGRRLIGRVEIRLRSKRAPMIAAVDAAGKRLGRFKTEKAALRAIDRAAGNAA